MVGGLHRQEGKKVGRGEPNTTIHAEGRYHCFAIFILAEDSLLKLSGNARKKLLLSFQILALLLQKIWKKHMVPEEIRDKFQERGERGSMFWPCRFVSLPKDALLASRM